MNQFLIRSDHQVIRSDEYAEAFLSSSAQTPPQARAWPAAHRTAPAWVTDRDLQACGRPNCHCVDGPGHGPKRYLSVSQQGGRLRRDYVPNAAHPQVMQFIANFRKLREVLDEICAINTELLRRREDLG